MTCTAPGQAEWATPPHERPCARHLLPPPLRHCWYDGGLYGRQAALLLKWRTVEDRYDGLVVVATFDEAGERWAVTEMWVDSGLLSPVWQRPARDDGQATQGRWP